MNASLDYNEATLDLAGRLHIRFCKKVEKIVEVLYKEIHPEPSIDTGFAPIGWDEPYRVIISEDPIGFAGGVNQFAYVHNQPTMFIDPLGLWAFVYNGGAHLWLPGLPGATGINVSSTWSAPYDNGPVFQGITPEYVIGSLADIGANAGISGLSGIKAGDKTDYTIGVGKYLGFQFSFVNGKFDGLTTGFGVGLSLPEQITRPLSDLKKCQ